VIAEADVARVVERLVALYDPDRIYVFGSYAKGTLTENSDLDLVVVKATRTPPWLRGRDVVALLADTAIDFDLLFVTPIELKEALTDPYSLLSSVMPSAKTLYERG
jgi:predicted nucleotidyltransferase